MSDPSAPGRAESEWLTLGEAARKLGVDETTLRGWADAGKVRVFRTPGGHRRFNAADLGALLRTAARDDLPRRAGGAPLDASALWSAVRQVPESAEGRAEGSARDWIASRSWFDRIDQAARARARDQCGRLVRTLGAYLAEEADKRRHLAEGRRVGAGLGREVARWGLTPAQSTEVFLHFKRGVTGTLATGPAGSAGRVRSLRDADEFLGEALQAMMEAYEQERAT